MDPQSELLRYDPPPASLAGRVVLITGANRGIGCAVARACADAGATVLLLGRDAPGLERQADEIAAAGCPEPLIVPLDLEGAAVGDYDAVAALIETRCGRLDGLVLNAGLLGELSPIHSYDPLLWARVFQVNVHSVFFILRAMLGLLERAADASVILTSSGVGRRGRACWGAYAVSKFAVEGLAQTLADELAGNPAIRVNALNPGRVRTRMRATAYPGEDPASLAPPAHIVNAYLFLLGRASRGISGQTLDAQAP